MEYPVSWRLEILNLLNKAIGCLREVAVVKKSVSPYPNHP